MEQRLPNSERELALQGLGFSTSASETHPLAAGKTLPLSRLITDEVLIPEPIVYEDSFHVRPRASFNRT